MHPDHADAAHYVAPGRVHPPRVVVVGAGFSGLAAAYELIQRGFRPIVLEADPDVGGLAAAFQVDGARVERFYHHWFTNDQHVMELVREIGLEARVVYKPTRTGMYFANQIYRLSTPLDVMRFPVLPVADRVRLGLTVLRARQVRNWREIDHLSAAEWLRKLGGDRAFRVVWEPLLRGKFGPHAEDVSAAWFWSKLRLRGGSRGARGEEQLAYFQGGFAALADELVDRIVRRGGEVRLQTPALGLVTKNGRVRAVQSEAGPVEADAVVLTPALPIVAQLMRPHVDGAYADRIGAIDYLANVCVVLELTRSLSEIYWMNVNDPAFPFVGVIEHTNLDQADPSGRRHIVYFSRYLPASDPMFGASSDEIIRFTLPYVRRMFPDLGPECIKAAHVWQARYAQPLVVRNYSQLVPPHQTPIPGLFIASMAQIYPEDRGTNYAIRDGRAVARLADAFLSTDIRAA
jgi:protoporphyrinogen oxidase